MSEALSRFQADLVGLLFRKDYERHLDALVDRRDARARDRFRVYRRMARTRLREVVEHSFPRLRRILGARFTEVVDTWLDVAPPRSPYLRAVPGELAAWLAASSSIEGVPGASPWLGALARYEWSLLEVEYAHQEEGEGDVHDAAELALDRPAVLTPAHRIVRFDWAVHRVPEEPEGVDLEPLVTPGDFALCVYRDPTTHAPRVLELSPVAAAILEAVAPGDRPVVDAVRDASTRHGFAIDAPFVESFGALVADLVERGVWLGSRA